MGVAKASRIRYDCFIRLAVHIEYNADLKTFEIIEPNDVVDK